jgi:hypothetical protein
LISKSREKRRLFYLYSDLGKIILNYSIELSYGLALIIGFAVSLDVGGLLISQHEDFVKKGALWRSLKAAILHAATHSILFLVFFYVVWLLVLIPKEAITFLKTIVTLQINLQEVLKTTLLLSSLIIIIFVWVTYAQKVIENHQDKVKGVKSQVPDARLDVRLILAPFRALGKKWTGGRLGWVLSIFVALTVAVDMAAITSFMRTLFVISPDSANISGGVVENLSHFDFGVPANLEPWLFSVLIFASVLFWSVIATIVARVAGERRNGVLGLMRVAEPFLVFWFLAVSIDHLFGQSLGSATDFIVKIVQGAIVSAILTCLLVLLHGWSVIKECIKKGSDITMDNLKEPAIFIEDDNLSIAIWKLVKYGVAALFFILFAFYCSHGSSTKEGDGLGAFLNVLTMMVAVLTPFAFYAPIARIGRVEELINKDIATANVVFSNSGMRVFLCSMAAYFVVVTYIWLSFSSSKGHEHTNAAFIVPLAYIGFLFSCTYLLAYLRENRSATEIDSRKAGSMITVSDILGAFAVVVFFWQICRKLLEFLI